MFFGCTMTFDNKNCTAYDLMLYDFSSAKQEDVPLTSSGKAITDHVPGRHDTFLYGIDLDTPLSYTMVLTLNEDRVNSGTWLSRAEINSIAQWLCGHSTYRTLTIGQDDMASYSYRCIISDMKILTHGALPWALSFKVTCDSPFAYTASASITHTATNNGATFTYANNSAIDGYYYPVLEFTMRGTSVSVVNASDGGRAMIFTELPSAATTIQVDCRNQIIKHVTSGTVLNLYPYFNFQFLRLVRGNNSLTLTGDFDMVITSEFPVDIGA